MIRIRCSGGTHTYALGGSFADLRAYIHTHTGIAPAQQTLFGGFPPRPLQPAATLQDAGIRAGDTIVVERAAAPAVPLPDGVLAVRIVPDDNSCLFNAVSYAQSGQISPAAAMAVRQVACAQIEGDPAAFSDAVLGMPRAKYVAQLRSPTTWGGAIELAALSAHFGVEIWCWDVQSGACHRFGEGRAYAVCWMLVYSGIHYDVIEARGARQTTAFADPPVDACVELISALRAQHYYTDTAAFRLVCRACGATLHGERAAAEHASRSGHTDFGEM